MTEAVVYIILAAVIIFFAIYIGDVLHDAEDEIKGIYRKHSKHAD